MKIAYVALIALVLALPACSLGGALPTQGETPTADVSFTPTPESTAPSPVVAALPTATPAPPVSATPTPESTTPSPAVAAPPTATPAPVEPAPPAGQCRNPYYPVSEGATWQYQLSGASSDTFVRSIPSVRDNGFDDQDVFSSGTTRRGSWECKEGDLIGLTPASAGAAVTATGVQADFRIESNTGVTFPADPQPGQKWTQNIVFLGSETVNGVTIESRNVLETSCQAVAMERVSVPAGDFEALRIDCTTKMDIFVSGNPAFSFTGAASNWYAAGVGLVKSSGATSLGATEITLLSYTIP